MKKGAAKKPSAAEREAVRWLEWEDAVVNHCHTLTTLAELLAHTGRNDVVKVEVVNDTGSLMKAEVARLKQRLLARPGRRTTP
jgi:hypothetical protein